MVTSEPHDNHVYSWVMLTRETVDFSLRAIDFYLGLLGDEISELEKDEDLAALVTDDTRRELGIGMEKARAERMREWLSGEMDKGSNPQDIDLSLTHWTARFLKSVCLLYLAKLKTKRNRLASRPNVTSNTLSAVDREISAKEELFASAGIFKNATALELLAAHEISAKNEQSNATNDEAPLIAVSRPRPVFVDSIQILDHELRSRCLDLFNQFNEAGQPDRNDTVLSEASRVLETRLRSVLACTDGSATKWLISTAFAGDTPRLKLSTSKGEQEAVMQLFFGTFGHVRNPVLHNLVGNMQPDRVLQLLGWIDYLLSLLATAEQTFEKPPS